MKLEVIFEPPQRKLTREDLSTADYSTAGHPLAGNVSTLFISAEAPSLACSSRFTLNLTRKHMVSVGYSPSVRLFEAAGCGAVIISDDWAGLETFFVPGEEILLSNSSDEVIRYLVGISNEDALRIGRRAQERVLAEHSAEKRAIQFEEFVEAKTLASQYA
jgi:spore maturation protein CgeB